MKNIYFLLIIFSLFYFVNIADAASTKVEAYTPNEMVVKMTESNLFSTDILNKVKTLFKINENNTLSVSKELFTRNLKLGSSGKDVKELNNFLISKGYASSGSDIGMYNSTYFSWRTKEALSIYQAVNGISPAEGYFGAVTRNRIIADNSEALTIPKISSISLTQARVDAQIEIKGVAFNTFQTGATSGNYVLLDDKVASPLIKTTKSNSLTFKVPSSLTSKCGLFSDTVACSQVPQDLSVGTHKLSVITANGKSNEVNFYRLPNSNECVNGATNYPSCTSCVSPKVFNRTTQLCEVPTNVGQCGSANSSAAVTQKPSTNLCASGSTASTVSGPGGGWSWTCAGSNGGTTVTCSAPFTESNTVSSTPTISSISPTSGRVDSQVTITGTGFNTLQSGTTKGNYVLLDDKVASSLILSTNSTGLTFKVPSQLTSKCGLFSDALACSQIPAALSVGTHKLSVITANGKSNEVNFEVTAQAEISGITIDPISSAQRGKSVDITWKKGTNVKDADFLNIDLVKGAEIKRLVSKVRASEKKWTWNIPTSQTIGSYTIKISSMANTSVKAESSAFSITDNTNQITTCSNGATNHPSCTTCTLPKVFNEMKQLCEVLTATPQNPPASGTQIGTPPSVSAIGQCYKSTNTSSLWPICCEILNDSTHKSIWKTNNNTWLKWPNTCASDAATYLLTPDNTITPPSLGSISYNAIETLNQTLKQGQSGDQVATLQTALQQAGVYSGPITGFFGDLTKKAVATFQQANALEAIGEVGPKTRELLNSLIGR